MLISDISLFSTNSFWFFCWLFCSLFIVISILIHTYAWIAQMLMFYLDLVCVMFKHTYDCLLWANKYFKLRYFVHFTMAYVHVTVKVIAARTSKKQSLQCGCVPDVFFFSSRRVRTFKFNYTYSWSAASQVLNWLHMLILIGCFLPTSRSLSGLIINLMYTCGLINK